MRKIPDEVVEFFHSQSFVIVLTIDNKARPHAACKGIVEIDKEGRIYLLDLYKQATFNNLKISPYISIVGVNEHKFKGYCLKGKARIISYEEMNTALIKAWEERVATRITQRVIKNIAEEKGRSHHPEALLPKPQYLIAMEVEEIIDLTPGHLKKGA